MELIKIVKNIIDSKPKEENQIILPIDMLNDLPVSIKIVIQPNLYNYLFFIDVDCDDIVDYDEEPLKLLCHFFYEIPILNSVIDNDEFIHSFKKIMNELKYNNKTGKINEDEEDQFFFRELITNPSISFQEEETCPVCMEITKTKTNCFHNLCLRCWSKIKSIEGIKSCPVCRGQLFYEKT
jgi:hypothetical protein